MYNHIYLKQIPLGRKMALFKKNKKQNIDNSKDSSVNSTEKSSSKIQTKSSIFKLFHIKDLKKEIVDLTKENQLLKEKADIRLSIKQMQPEQLDNLIKDKNEELNKLDTIIIQKKDKIKNHDKKIARLTSRLKELNAKIIDVSDEIKYESYGLYKPKYNFANSSTYKGKLSEIRANQKLMIKNEVAAEIIHQMTLNDSVSQGKKLQKKNIKQLLRSFNGECEAAINKVTKSNFTTIEKRINRSFEQLNKLNEENSIRITAEYLDSKIDEARLALEYALKKEEEKEILREQRQREQEERQLQRELENERKKYEKDESHFQKAERLVEEKIKQTTNESELISLKNELQQLQAKLATIQEKKEKLENRAANPTAGYVYIISNVGSFGKDIYKIGVTRRLDPMDRINELGSASVPFKFDVHALIFSDQAYQLEAELHNYFDKQRINKVNRRKEYFNITINEIKKVLKEHKDLTFDFHEVPEASEYRDSLLIEKNN